MQEKISLAILFLSSDFIVLESPQINTLSDMNASNTKSDTDQENTIPFNATSIGTENSMLIIRKDYSPEKKSNL